VVVDDLAVALGQDSSPSEGLVVDDVGRRLADKTVRTNTEGHLDLLGWSRRLPGADAGELVFALEDCRHLTRRLEADLLSGGARVVRVPTRLMAEARKVSREPGKSDPIDAQAVAMAALRHPEPLNLSMVRTL
jgi:transposase